MAHQGRVVRGVFYASFPADLRKTASALRDRFGMSASIGEVLQNDEGDFRLVVRIHVREVPEGGGPA
jgi:hypothetical protein